MEFAKFVDTVLLQGHKKGEYFYTLFEPSPFGESFFKITDQKFICILI